MTKRVLTCIASGVIALASPTSWACSYDGCLPTHLARAIPEH